MNEGRRGSERLALEAGWGAVQGQPHPHPREPGEAEPPGPPHPWAQQLWFRSAECLMVLRYSGNTYRKRERQPGDGGGGCRRFLVRGEVSFKAFPVQ